MTNPIKWAVVNSLLQVKGNIDLSQSTEQEGNSNLKTKMKKSRQNNKNKFKK